MKRLLIAFSVILSFSVIVTGVVAYNKNNITEPKLVENNSYYQPIANNNKMINSSVSIYMSGIGLDEAAVGSGVIVKSELGLGILTAKHVAEFAEEFSNEIKVCAMKTNQCTVLSSTFISSSSSKLTDDWAFFPIEKVITSTRTAKIDHSKLKIGEDVFLVGTPWGEQPWLSKGIVSWVYNNLFCADAHAVPGFSGGGAFNGRGKLIGIITAMNVGPWGPEDNQILIIPISQISILNG